MIDTTNQAINEDAIIGALITLSEIEGLTSDQKVEIACDIVSIYDPTQNNKNETTH